MYQKVPRIGFDQSDHIKELVKRVLKQFETMVCKTLTFKWPRASFKVYVSKGGS